MNIFNVLNLSEKYHSKILAWLLNPYADHELGFDFLVNFLRLVDINPMNFRSIKTEYTVYAPDNIKRRRPDIYLQVDEHNIFIENKVQRSAIDDTQLREQADYIHKSHNTLCAKIYETTLPNKLVYNIEGRGEKDVSKSKDSTPSQWQWPIGST